MEDKWVRESFNSVRCWSVEYIKAAIRINLFINDPFTNKAMQWATNIYGPDIVQLKAQTTRRRPNPVVNTSIDIIDKLI